MYEGRGLTHSETELQHMHSSFLLQEVHKAEEEVLLLPDLLQIQLQHLEEEEEEGQMEKEKEQGEEKIRRRKRTEVVEGKKQGGTWRKWRRS